VGAGSGVGVGDGLVVVGSGAGVVGLGSSFGVVVGFSAGVVVVVVGLGSGTEGSLGLQRPVPSRFLRMSLSAGTDISRAATWLAVGSCGRATRAARSLWLWTLRPK